MRGSSHVGRGAGRRLPAASPPAPSFVGERWARHEATKQRSDLAPHVPAGAGRRGARAALPRVAGAATRVRRRRRRRPSASSCSSRSARSWSRSGTRRFTGNGYALKDSKYTGSKADGTTLLTQKLVPGKNYTWAPLTDFQTRPASPASSGPALNPFLAKLTLIRGLDFLPSVNHNYGGLLGNFSSCTTATPCDADSSADVPDHRSGAGVLVEVLSERAGAALPAHLAGRRSTRCRTRTSAMQGGAGPAAEGAHQPAGRVQRRVRRRSTGGGGDAAAADARQAARRSRATSEYTRLQAEHAAVRRRTSRRSTSYVTLVSRAAGEADADRHADDVVHARRWRPASMANNSGTDPTDITHASGTCSSTSSTAALMCDRTRIITIGVHKALGPGPDSANTTLVGHYHSEDASGGTWHGLAHDWCERELAPHAEGDQRLDRRARCSPSCWRSWTSPRWAAPPTSTTRSSTGATSSASTTSRYSVPCLLAGSAGGFIKPGRYLDYIDWDGHAYFSQEDGNVIKGIPHNQFLVTALQAMGLAARRLRERRQGRLRLDQHQRPRRPTLWATDYDLATVGQILPGIRPLARLTAPARADRARRRHRTCSRRVRGLCKSACRTARKRSAGRPRR